MGGLLLSLSISQINLGARLDDERLDYEKLIVLLTKRRPTSPFVPNA